MIPLHCKHAATLPRETAGTFLASSGKWLSSFCTQMDDSGSQRRQDDIHLLAEFVAFGVNDRVSIDVLLLVDAAVNQFLG